MKGIDVEIILGAFILMVVFVSLIYAAFFGLVNQKVSGVKDTVEYGFTGRCATDNDCQVWHVKTGSKCLLTYPGDYVAFCGCLTTEDCVNGGSCDMDSKCS